MGFGRDWVCDKSTLCLLCSTAERIRFCELYEKGGSKVDRQKGRKPKRLKGRKAERQEDKNTQRQKGRKAEMKTGLGLCRRVGELCMGIATARWHLT